MTLLVYILELRMREGEYSVLKAPPLAVSRDQKEKVYIFGILYVYGSVNVLLLCTNL